MKIRETRRESGTNSFGEDRWRDVTFTRVRELAKGEEAPEGAEIVDDKTPVSDWKQVKE